MSVKTYFIGLKKNDVNDKLTAIHSLIAVRHYKMHSISIPIASGINQLHLNNKLRESTNFRYDKLDIGWMKHTRVQQRLNVP